MTFAPGSGYIFTFDKTEERGTRAPWSICRAGERVFYMAEDGFYVNINGKSATIGAERVNRTFFTNLDMDQYWNVLGATDPIHNRIYWSWYSVDNAGNTYNDELLIYDWHLDQWSHSENNIYYVFPAATQGTSLADLDALGYTLDSLPFSLDSRIWQGGAPLLAAFNSDNKLAFFDGANMEATVETPDMQVFKGWRAFVNGVEPIVDNANAFVAVGTRERLGDTRVWGSESSIEENGVCSVRSSGRYHRFRLRIPASETWNHAKGVEALAEPDGQR